MTARTSSGTPDHANDLSSGREMEDAWSNFLNLFMRVMRELMASASLEEVLLGMEG